MSRFHLRLMNREIALPHSGDVVVGRDAACEITIDDARASRRHATFHVTPGMVTVEDNGSLNGVRVNDVPIKGLRTVAHGERVEVGSHVFILMDSERSSRTSATKSAPHAMTRRVEVASVPRGAETPLESVARALQVGDVAKAARTMDALVPRFAEVGADAEADLGKAVALLIQLATQPRCGRFLDRVFQIHAARKIVPSGESIDALKAVLPDLGPTSAVAIESYLAAMGPHSAALPVVDQVRLRRIASLVRTTKAPG